ncbi:ABC-type transport system substrate-binding protein [Bradyrhizobium sp. GM22.5]
MFKLMRRGPRAFASKLALSLVALSTALASPVLAAGKTITAVMHSDLRIIDPIFTTAYITRDHGYMIYDTLVAPDSNFKIQPQMADWKISDDKLTYTFTLRDGLKWHDGAPVTAEDCVASLKRWAAVDGMGQKLLDFTASIEPTDAKTITLKLKEPYGLVLDSIGKPSSRVAFMMPKRLAETPPDKQIPEQIGSGPFKFVQSEFQPGVKAVYVKNTDYVPRKEPSSWTSGGKVVKVDRVEWITMPDSQTAVNALQSGDIDFVENLPYDMLPLLEANKDITIEVSNKFGFQTLGRMNFLYPPFDNVKVRRAAFLAINQKDVLDALVGNAKYQKVCGAFFVCDTPFATEAGAETLVKGNGMAEAKKALAESGYDGTPDRDHGPRRCHDAEGAADRCGSVAARGRLQGRPASDRLADGGEPPRQSEASERGRLEHVLHQLGRGRRLQPDRQSLDRRPGQEGLVRLGRERQDRKAQGRLRSRRLARRSEEDRR